MALLFHTGDPVIILIGQNKGLMGEVTKFKSISDDVLFEVKLASGLTSDWYRSRDIISTYCPNCDQTLTFDCLEFATFPEPTQELFNTKHPIPICRFCNTTIWQRDRSGNEKLQDAGKEMLIRLVPIFIGGASVSVLRALDLAWKTILIAFPIILILGFVGTEIYNRIKDRGKPPGLGLK
jgi:hypothetical protein